MHTHAPVFCVQVGIVTPSQRGSGVPADTGWHVPPLPHALHVPQAGSGVPTGAGTHADPVLSQTWHVPHRAAQQIWPLLPAAGSQ